MAFSNGRASSAWGWGRTEPLLEDNTGVDRVRSSDRREC